MRSIVLLLAPVVALSPLACGGTVESTSSTTGTTSTSTSASTGTGISGSGGAGGSGGSGSSASSSASSSTGTGGGSACAGYLDVTEQGAAPQHFASICQGSWGANETKTAVGYRLSGGAPPGLDQLEINGCADLNSDIGLHLTTAKASAPGTFTEGSAAYSGGYGTANDSYQVVITKLDEPGGVIEGTFALTVTGPTDGKKSLKGSFHVCRVQDENVP